MEYGLALFLVKALLYYHYVTHLNALDTVIAWKY